LRLDSRLPRDPVERNRRRKITQDRKQISGKTSPSHIHLKFVVKFGRWKGPFASRDVGARRLMPDAKIPWVIEAQKIS
jgi:hypothetical protein